jgi:hypothetical protein
MRQVGTVPNNFISLFIFFLAKCQRAQEEVFPDEKFTENKKRKSFDIFFLVPACSIKQRNLFNF